MKRVAKFTKKAFCRIISVMESTGRARAAAHLANMGYYKEARDVMLQKETTKC